MSLPPRRGRLTLRLLAVLLIAVAGTYAPSAAAENSFTLDSQATSPGRVVMDSAGNAYVAWTHASSNGLPDTPMVCKIPPGGVCDQPISLQIPGAVDNTDAVSGVFPVMRDENAVYVLAPRYSKGDAVLWSSFNLGENFTPGLVIENGYPKESEPTTVLSTGSFLFPFGFNPGLGFGLDIGGFSSGANYRFFSAGAVGGASAGLEGSFNPVLAYWSVAEPHKMSFYRFLGGETFDPEVSWEGPIPIGDGYQVKLASDAGRLFMVSQDYVGGPRPSRIDVRHYEGTSFGAPISVAEDPAAEPAIGGAIDESPAGEVAVAWPSPKAADQARVMRLFTSINRGTSFSDETAVARIGGGYRSGDNAQLIFSGDGSGLLTYRDGGGLQVANLKPLSGPAQPSAKPPNYKGKKRTISKRLGAFAITMQLPKGCVQSLQSFPVVVSKKKRHGAAARPGQKLTLKRVAFSYDGRKLATKRKKPFRSLVDPGALLPRSSHRVSAKVSAVLGVAGRGKKVVRTLKGPIKGC
jgi:hypothetical protein